MKISGNIVDVVSGRIFKGSLEIENGKIKSVKEEEVQSGQYILPGLVDSHVHIESSMLVPSAFARLAVIHGTTATVSDPHEIANVLGKEGVEFMIDNAKSVPFKFYFGAPSCVPATPFETSGAQLNADELDELLKNDDIHYLGEMMNFPGVIHQDAAVMEKLQLAKKYGKPVDGHAPGLLGEEAQKYADAGISTDHECFTTEEAIDKIKCGIKVQIREGSAARNMDSLMPLMKDFPGDVMICSDDKHPDDLVKGHVNLLIQRALDAGIPFMETLKTASLNPVKHYKLDAGLLQEGDDADFIILDDIKDFSTVCATYIRGEKVAENGKSLLTTSHGDEPNLFMAEEIKEEDIRIPEGEGNARIIKALEGELITAVIEDQLPVQNGNCVSDTNNDYLKMLVLNRYEKNARPAIAFIHGFELKKGAMASTVAHDSHNIIAVGANDKDLVKAVNLVIGSKGGISYVDSSKNLLLPLPVAGLMSYESGDILAKQYLEIDHAVKKAGSKLRAPFMTLSFMALLVIPELKLSDKGLFDGKNFRFTSLFNK